MIKKLYPYMKKYKKALVLAILFSGIEVVFELVIPLIMAKIVDVGISSGDIAYTIKLGILMVCLALISLSLGLGAARFAAVAGQGLGAEIREAEYKKIQTYSFKNIEKFSTASFNYRYNSNTKCSYYSS